MNSTNTVISAQDYDCWGYLMENRSYQSENSKYKFTGKERDKDLENNYDYFGARYYDSRIGRWGGVEPLLNKYLSFSPYVYTINNPILYKDKMGMDVYIHGDDWKDVYKELKSNFKNSKFSLTYEVVDKNTIKLGFSGDATNEIEQMLADAIGSEDIINLFSTIGNYFTEKGEDILFAIGSFGGSNKIDGKFQANQFLNMKSARDFAGMHEAPNVASSVLHEILEAIIGQQEFKGLGYDDAYYDYAHKKTTSLQSERSNYQEQFILDPEGINVIEVRMLNTDAKKSFHLFYP